jgi:putative tributyrin esterase
MALLQVDFFSQTLGMATQMNVYLPERKQVPYPTLYLLHGMSDDHTMWTRRSSIERYAEAKGIAVVMPTTHLGWYTDMHIGFDYFKFISEELIEICRGFFPNMSTKHEDTFAAGLSVGGYGALKLGLLKPETFSWVAPLSGALDINAMLSPEAGNDNNESINRLFLDIFGPPESVAGSDNDLMAAAERLAASGKPKPNVYIWCGTEDFLYQQNITMRDHLQKLGYNLTFEESAGDHSWGYWDAKIQTVLDWLPVGDKQKEAN